jgi:hypothetical protein
LKANLKKEKEAAKEQFGSLQEAVGTTKAGILALVTSSGKINVAEKRNRVKQLFAKLEKYVQTVATTKPPDKEL